MVAVKRAYVDTSIGQIHYRHAGEGGVLLLLHHTASSSHFFEPLMRACASSLSVFAVDTPGFGLSDHPPHPYTIADYARSIAEFLHVLNIPTANILGHHTGASIACELAASVPETVNKLILSGPACFDVEQRKQWLGKVRALDLKEDGSHLQPLWGYMTGLSPEGRDLELEEKHEEYVWRLKAGPRSIDAYRAVFSYDMASRLPLIQSPTLVISGEHDTLIDAVEPSAHLLKRVQVRIVPDASVFLAVQDPEGMARIILDFIAKPGI